MLLVKCAMVLGQVMRGDTEGTWVPGFSLVPRMSVRPHHSPGSILDPQSLRRGLDSDISILGIPIATACVGDGGSTLQVLGANSVTVYSSEGVSQYSPGERFPLISG